MDNDKYTSINGYSQLWGWSRNKTRRFVNELRTGKGQVVDKKGTGKGQEIMFIFHNLVPVKDKKGTGKGQVVDRKRDATINTNTNTNNKKTYGVKNKLFEKFWNLYPLRNGKKLLKADAGEFFLKKIKDEDIPKVLTATQNYANSESVKQGVGIRDAIRFLKKEFWRSWIEPEEKQKKPLDKIDYSEYSCEKCSREAGESISHRYNDELFRECLKLRNEKIIKKERERMAKIEARV